MTSIERRALLGDAEAQRECTEKGIVLRCSLCGSIYTQVRHMGWSEPAQAFEAGYRGECTVCHAVSGAHTTEKEALADWNRRPAPPIGRCKECSNWDKNTGQSHPCCYVRTDLPDRESQNIECHGGITFSSYAFEEFDVKGHYIGWDYAHCGDLTGWIGRGVAHTTEEMYSDVKKVIDQIIKLEGGEKNG